MNFRGHRKLKHALTKLHATVEHVQRRCDGGGNALSNQKLACVECNSRRGELSFEDWRDIRKNIFQGSCTPNKELVVTPSDT